MRKLDLRSWGFGFIVVLATAAFIRLGAWQIERLGERRAANAEREALADDPQLDLSGDAELPAVDSLLWRRVRLTGTWDFEHELVIRGRSAFGSPGVDVVTPLRLESGATVLVLRGWLPAADGLSADLASASPPPADLSTPRVVEVTGRVYPGEPSAAIPPRRTRFPGGVHVVLASLDLEAAQRELEEPLIGAWVLPDSAVHAGGAVEPRLVQMPPPSDGPHLMYAIQWFGFAAIAAAGGIVFLASRRSSPGGDAA